MQLFYECMMQWKRKAKEGRKKIRSKGLAKDEKKKKESRNGIKYVHYKNENSV